MSPGDPYSELKSQLLDSMEKKDPERLENALRGIEKKVPPAKIPIADRELLEKARELFDKIDSQKGIH